MTQTQKWSLLILRLTLGWIFLYAGYTKIASGTFSAAGYMKNAANFTGFYHWLSQPGLIGPVSFLNEWALFLIGVALILGVAVKFSSMLGAVLMLLYYFVLKFPHSNANSYIIDEHIIYLAAFLVLAAFRAGRSMGLSKWVSNWRFFQNHPGLREWLA